MDWYDSLRSWFQSWFGPSAAPVQFAAPSVATTPGSTSTFGTASEGSGRTCTGAKCYKNKKTLRRHRRK